MLTTNGKYEIGSEFWDVPFIDIDNDIFKKDTHWYISGTAALESIIEDILSHNNIRTVAIPSWCCSCMYKPFLKRGIKVLFYPVIFDNGKLVCDYSGTIADCWIIMSFFGYSTCETIGKPKGLIICDLTHSIFTGTNEYADYYFGSLRKWAGFYTGGFAWSNTWFSDKKVPSCDPYYIFLRSQAMKEKNEYIKGDSDSKHYLYLFEKGEVFLDNCEIMAAYEMDIHKARHLDVKRIIKQRQNNAKVLLETLNKWALFPEIDYTDCPMFVPILLENEKRTTLHSYLKRNNIFLPIHWPLDNNRILSDKEKELYLGELSVVCDQRYDEEDMQHLVTVIKDAKILEF